MNLAQELKKIIKGDISTDAETLEKFSKDASIFVLKPQIVVTPKDSKDIEKLVTFVNDHPELNLSITPRAAGTCMSGGPLSESIVLDMTRHFDRVKKVGKNYAITEPGVYYRVFEKETLKKDLLLPCYTSSRELNTVGGMVGNNSAGEKTLSYGQTERWVKELKVILTDGKQYVFKKITQRELEKKIKQTDFEGIIYKRIFDIIRDNYAIIKKAKPNTSKNSTGYYLWNVWDEESQTFDLTKIIVGSQGTLGIVTEITFDLITPKKETSMLEIELKNLTDLDKIVNDVLEFKPESFECFDDQTIKFSFKYVPDVLADYKKHTKNQNEIKLLPKFLKDLFVRLPKLVLIAEFAGNTKEEVLNQATQAQKSLQKFTHIQTRVVSSNEEEKYWILRRDSFNILRHHSGENLRTAPFIDDIIVPPEKLPEFLPQLNKVLAPYRNKIIYTLAGHIGNGNFHIIPLMNLNDQKMREIIPELSKKVFDLVAKFDGSMAAEHNDGLVRGPFLEKMYGQKMFELFKEVKTIFDPNNIFNPNKKAQATFDYSYSHMSGTGITVSDYKKQ